jgi:hypothetical protein
MSSNEASFLAKLIPGFGSYASEQKRRDDDLSLRRFLIDRLQGTKKLVQRLAMPLVDRCDFEGIRSIEGLRLQIDTLQSKLRGAVEGYSSVASRNRVDESKLKEVLELDNDLVAFIDKLDSILSELESKPLELGEAKKLLERIDDRFSRRDEILGR